MTRSPFPELIREADRCVLCGLCLPVCPTYRLLGREGESPRGRISLIRALAEGNIAADRATLAQLDHCLGCRACEAACPSKVRYGRLIDGARALLARGPARPTFARRLAATLTDRRRLRRAVRWARVAQRLGATRLHRLARMLPRLAAPRPLTPSAGDGMAGRVRLFAGCLGETLDQGTVAAAERLLTHLGHRVETPSAQRCCGALDQHAGRGREARGKIAANIATFEGDAPILSLNSGCAAQLAEYGEGGGPGEAFAAHHRELTAFLAEAAWPPGSFRPLEARVAVHEPCSQRNVLGGGAHIYGLLRRIPGAEPTPLPGNESCCGAAGDYMVREPEIADALRRPKLDAVMDLAPAIIVSTNRGCILHLAAGLRERGLEVEILHPLELLARQLEAHEP